MNLETWVTLGCGLLFSFIGYVWKTVIEKRFEEMSILTKENHLELKTALSLAMTVDKCKIYQDAHNKEHERFEKDLNAIGCKLDLHIREDK
jgi:hypothetical protein